MVTSITVSLLIIGMVALLFYAITRKRDITFNASWLGAKVHLEAKGDSRKK